MEGHTTITSQYPDDEPKSPKGAKTTVVNQCGYYVRENIPISFKLWKRNKVTDSDADIVLDTEKEMLRVDVKQHFNFQVEHEQLFKDWVMKKIAIAFQTFKKNLNKDYVKKGLTPDFEKDFKKQRPYWDAFVQYKSYEDSEQRTAKARENASKKIHFHHLGQRRLQDGDSKVAEDGRRSHVKSNRTGNLQLADASKVFLLCSRRHIEYGRWLVCH
jgi:hypothetical protein